ncbi:NAD-dependent epimerase/dehydratase family protein [Porticoccaceae bacterium]|nr:NAD-dependent epimerase/dehydratase family protein [Porticoccaceae bacterium]
MVIITSEDITLNIIVTGGAGFIGSWVVKSLLRSSSNNVMSLDSLTYAGNIKKRNNIRFSRLSTKHDPCRKRTEYKHNAQEH